MAPEKIHHSFKPHTLCSCTLACDNCAGQNKNNIMLRLINPLIKGGYFYTITIAFLVKDHIKKSYDRNFSIMKKELLQHQHFYKGLSLEGIWPK